MKKVMLLFITISVFTAVNVQAQSINLGIGGGLTLVQAPAFYTDQLNFSSEYHVGIKGKLNIPLFPITPIGFIDYHFLRGTASTEAGDVDTKQNVFSIGLGGELPLIPGPISPYLGLDFEFNNFGDLTIGSTTSSGMSRSGIGVGAGIMFKLLPVINIDASLKYQMLNLIGKKDTEDTIGIINFNVALFF